MRLVDYLKGQAIRIGVHFICALLLSIFLNQTGSSIDVITLILIAWLVILVTVHTYQYLQRKSHFTELLALADSLDQKYIIAEIMDAPPFPDSIPYYELLKQGNRSMLERIAEINREVVEYREYIESWVHEIKSPIAAIKLTAENDKNTVTRRILSDLEQIENHVEQALFYARSGSVDKDYLVKETQLSGCVEDVLVKFKQMFIQNGIAVELHGLDCTVYSDHKWLSFIIGQILINAVNYRNKQEPKITISADKRPGYVELSIRDNGMGIIREDLPRVFEKGFTGANGRQRQSHATGIGLYLCQKLCSRLGHPIQIESEFQHYTCVILQFPKGSMFKVE